MTSKGRQQISQSVVRRWEEIDAPTRTVTRTIDTTGTRSHSLAQAVSVLREFGLLGDEG